MAIDLLALSKKYKEVPKNQSILMYGDSGVGKSRMAATVAQIPWVERVFWLDLDNSMQTLFHMGLSDAEMQKIIPFRMGDTRKDPYVLNTIQKMYSSATDLSLCEEHSRMNCLECNKAKAGFQTFNMTKLTNRDVIVFDNGSSFFDAIINFILKGQSDDAILQIQDWGTALNFLKPILQVIQNGRYGHTIMTAHTLYIHTFQGKPPNREIVKTKEFPMLGTTTFAPKAGGYFGTVINLRIGGNKHTGISSTLGKPNVQARSRSGVCLEKESELHMKHFFPATISL